MASCPPTYAWADNTQHMDPCEVASSLRDVCDSSLPPLQPITSPNYTYPGPTTTIKCLCSNIIYALVSACSDCQGGRIDSWDTWSTNCSSPLVISYDGPLHANISIPAWAYFDVNSDPIYSSSIARSSAAILQATTSFTIANSTEAAEMEIRPTSTTTSHQTSSTDTSTLTTSGLTSLPTASFGSDLSSSTTRNRTAVIAGGTVAAVLLIAIGAALVYWYIRRRRRKRVPPSVAYMLLHGSVY